jgi:hypothetical protein
VARPAGDSDQHRNGDTLQLDAAEKAYHDGVAEAVRQLTNCLRKARRSSDPAVAREECHTVFTETMEAMKEAYEAAIEVLRR